MGLTHVRASTVQPRERTSLCQFRLIYLYRYCDADARTPLLQAFGNLCTVHDQRVDDPIASLPAAHGLHAAVVVSQCEMGFCAVVHKLALQGAKGRNSSVQGVPYQHTPKFDKYSYS